ncbi:hypothetical protein NPIL_393961 [Nephila pilipes]|uniref:Uncharacterized protein n=1 Tax=Nephila pilipes TaxID=299642 RepID=A0A8X6QLC6_NEPPI|nr:hypothetical protein NPIL_393961 [Nephila pilipes]
MVFQVTCSCIAEEKTSDSSGCRGANGSSAPDPLQFEDQLTYFQGTRKGTNTTPVFIFFVDSLLRRFVSFYVYITIPTRSSGDGAILIRIDIVLEILTKYSCNELGLETFFNFMGNP